MGWYIPLGIVFLLAILPLGVNVRYDADGPLVRMIAGPLKIPVFPRPKKEKKRKDEGKKKAEEKPEEKQEAPALPAPRKSVAPEPEKKPEEKTGGSWTDFLPLVRVALDFLGDFRRKLRVKVLNLKLIMAADDPCDLAVNYGRAWAAVGNLMPHLDRLFVIKKRNVEVECDFTASETLVIARLDITIALGRLLALLVRYAIRALKEFFTIKKKRKGGAAT